MKILQTPVRFESTGGVETYVRELSAALADRGIAVTVLYARSGGPAAPCDPRIRAIALSSRFRLANTDIPLSFPCRVLGEETDIIHAHLPTPWSADWSGFAARKKRTPLVLNYYNDISGRGFYGPVARMYNRTLLPRLLATAEKIVVLRSGPLPLSLLPYKEKVVVIAPGINCSRFTPGKSEPDSDVFFLSLLDRYHRYKGLDVLIRAAALVKESRPDLRIVVGGDGEEKARYRRLAGDLGISENVRFVGLIPGGMVPDYYRNSRIFVLPSLDPALEGFGIVALEAMASGIPVIATGVPGVAKDLEAEKAGIVVKRHDEESLAAALEYLLGHDEERKRMGKNGRKIALERYSWIHVAKEFEELYRNITRH